METFEFKTSHGYIVTVPTTGHSGDFCSLVPEGTAVPVISQESNLESCYRNWTNYLLIVSLLSFLHALPPFLFLHSPTPPFLTGGFYLTGFDPVGLDGTFCVLPSEIGSLLVS